MKKNSFILLLSFFLFLVLAKSDDIIIHTYCHKAAGGDPNIKYDFCVSSLGENPKTKSAATVADLVPIAIEISNANATSISAKVSTLLDNKTLEKYTKSCLKDCSQLYSDASSNLQSGERAVQSKDYGGANAAISAAMDAPTTCEGGFEERKGLVSPLTKENNDFFQLTAIVLSFINMSQ